MRQRRDCLKRKTPTQINFESALEGETLLENKNALIAFKYQIVIFLAREKLKGELSLSGITHHQQIIIP
jgi:hypothetical protein